tara:strand:+ start:6973 stop:7425 length:453 start_codon:yes stop_codon:yes gene_type:complete
MRVVIQRVSKAIVSINGEVKSAIKQGLLIFFGVEDTDTSADIDWLTKKIAQLRVFSDEQGLMNRSILDVKGEVLVVSQFTLHAKTKKGNRPSYSKAAKSEQAIPLYEEFVKMLAYEIRKNVKTGEFGANMQVSLCNDGPVTIIIDTKNKE